MTPIAEWIAKDFGISLTDLAKYQRLQFSCLGPYWADTIPPFLDADGKELPMLELTPDQLEICRALARLFAPRYYMIAAIMLLRDDGQMIVAVRLEAEWSYVSHDRGLVTATSSDNALTWDVIKCQNERGGPIRTLYLADPHNASDSVEGECDHMDIDSSDISMVDA